jgi:hypothetical protein
MAQWAVLSYGQVENVPKWRPTNTCTECFRTICPGSYFSLRAAVPNFFNLRIPWQPISINCHHHRLDSPRWALAFLRSFAHSSLSRATIFEFLTSNILISWLTPLSHRNFGLPTLLTPPGLVLNSFFRVLSLYIRIKCPAHANYLNFDVIDNVWFIKYFV